MHREAEEEGSSGSSCRRENQLGEVRFKKIYIKFYLCTYKELYLLTYQLLLERVLQKMKFGQAFSATSKLFAFRKYERRTLSLALLPSSSTQGVNSRLSMKFGLLESMFLSKIHVELCRWGESVLMGGLTKFRPIDAT